MKEIITLHVGQAGVQAGTALWELLCAEHNVTFSGSVADSQLKCEVMDILFQPISQNKWVPRSLFVDLEPTVIDEIRIGSFRTLFHPDRLVSGPEDAANNFARGFFTVGKLVLQKTDEQCRRLFEQSDHVQGMIFLRSLGGGTGSGLTAAMFEAISDYNKTIKIEVPVYPSPSLSNSIVEPYNCLLGEHFCMEDIDLGILLDNEAMYEICVKYLSLYTSTYNTINRLIAQVISSITVSARFLNILNCDLTVLQTNLIPYPRIHFPLCNFAPILNSDRASHQDLSVQEITRLVFDRQNQMLKVDHFYGKFMACALLYKGQICPHDVYLALNEIKQDKNIEFVDWCPTGFKVGINSVQPVTIPGSQIVQTKLNVAMLTNTSAISQAWQRLSHRFYLLFSKRSFVHWFVGEGMEESEFSESLYNLSVLVKDYEETGENTKNSQNDFISNDTNATPTKEKSLMSKRLNDIETLSKATKITSDKFTTNSKATSISKDTISSKKTTSSKYTSTDENEIIFKVVSGSTTENLTQTKSKDTTSLQSKLETTSNKSNKRQKLNHINNNQYSYSVSNDVSQVQETFLLDNQTLFSRNENPGVSKDVKETDEFLASHQENSGQLNCNFFPEDNQETTLLDATESENKRHRFKHISVHSQIWNKMSDNSIPPTFTFLSKNDKIKNLKLKYRYLQSQ